MQFWFEMHQLLQQPYLLKGMTTIIVDSSAH